MGRKCNHIYPYTRDVETWIFDIQADEKSVKPQRQKLERRATN